MTPSQRATASELAAPLNVAPHAAALAFAQAAEPQGAAMARLMAQVGGSQAVAHLHLHLVPDALKVRAYVQQPLAQCAPVGYQRELLDSHQPGTSFYLPANVRRQLQAWQAAVLDQPQ